jgi:uncharacterized MAPEG superfamily protein
MNNVLVALLILTLAPIVCAWIGGYYRRSQLGSIDNKEPRTQSLQLTGAGARAVAAQGNSWEALALYSAAVLALVIAGVDLNTVATHALIIAALRVVYVPLYIMNIDMLRSLAFLGSFGLCMYFFYLAISAA